MLNLRTYLLLFLISFSFQDKNCLSSFRFCVSNSEYEQQPVENGSIENCNDYNEDDNQKCSECKDGYAHSSDYKKCISFPNCYILEEGGDKCNICHRFFHPNANGQCIRTLCATYNNDGQGNENCDSCLDGYYLKAENQCEKIPISNCKEYDATNKRCKKCLDDDGPNADGNCNNAFIEGCIEYSNGECTKCDEENYIPKDGTCEFKNCESGERAVEGCYICQIGYETGSDGICIGYDGSKDTSSSSENIKVELAMIIFILALLV